MWIFVLEACVALGLLLEVYSAAQRQRRALAHIHDQQEDTDL